MIDAFEKDQAGQERLRQFKARVYSEASVSEFKSPEDLRGRLIEALVGLLARDNPKRFRVAFAFPGEKRAFVEQIAELLAARFGRDAILYDKYHEAEFARHDLGIYLPKLYGDQSDLIVPVLCPQYDQKRWTGWEWVHIYALLTKTDGQRVMPCRFEYANADGLSPVSGFIELDRKTPEETVTLILERLALNEGKPRDFYTRPPNDQPQLKTAVPHNLPRLQSFFGRTKELATIREALDLETRTWGALIDGPGGMGKTSLAVRAAYECTPAQFEQIVFVSIKDRELDDDGVRQLGTLLIPNLLALLNEVGRELQVREIEKSPEDQRMRILLDALRGRRVLLILDNLESMPREDRDLLYTFVKRLPQGCKAILTSRRRIGSSADTLILEAMDQDAALATLADLARHNKLLARTTDDERITLYQQTAGKPLLLRWVAGQLGRGGCRTLADALAFLRSCPPYNDPLEFIFGDLAFTAAETKILCALTCFTLPVEVKHLAAVAALEEEPAEMALRGLANRSLVMPDAEERAFALVPMVADFLRRHRPEVVRQTGQHLEQRAYALILENGDEKHDRFPVLDAAWPSVEPALALFLAGENARLQEVCDALADFLNFTGRWDTWLSLSQQAEAKALAANDYYRAGWRAYMAGYAHSLREEAEAVLACADRAGAHWELAKAGARERAFAIRLRGLGHQLRKDYAAAISAYRKSLDLDRNRSAESVEVAIGLNDLAEAERRSGDYDAAERDYREALRVARAVGYAEGVAIFTGNLAALALEREDWPQAEALAREALALSEKIGRQELIASNNRRIAEALLRQNQAAAALPHARRAVEIYTHLRSPDLKEALATLRECEASLADKPS